MFIPSWKTKEQFIENSINIHGNKYDYSLVEYMNSKTYIDLICHTHEIFKTKPNYILSGGMFEML